MFQAKQKIGALIQQRLSPYLAMFLQHSARIREFCQLKHHQFILATATFIASTSSCINSGRLDLSLALATLGILHGLLTGSPTRAALYGLPPVIAGLRCHEFLCPDKASTQHELASRQNKQAGYPGTNTQGRFYGNKRQLPGNNHTLVLLNRCGTSSRLWATATATVLNNSPDSNRVLLIIRGNNRLLPDLSPGRIASCTGKQLSIWETRYYPWEFDLRRYAQSKNCTAILTCSGQALRLPKSLNNQLSSKKPWHDFFKFADLSRNIIVAGHNNNLGSVRGNLLTSLILGEHAALVDKNIQEKFRVLGLSHLIAASGFNISLVLILATTFSRLFMPSKILHTAICLLALGFFVMLAGASASVERAAIMAICVLGAQFCYRTPYLPAILFFSAVITLLIQPGQIVDIGFQLSYAATFALVCAGSGLSNWQSSSKAITWLMQTCLAICAAQLFVLPIQLSTFASCSNGFLMANLLVAPVIPLITITGFLSSLCLLAQFFLPGLHSLSYLLDWLGGLGIDLVLLLTDLLSSFFPASQAAGTPPAWIIFLFYAILLAAKLHHHLTGKVLPFTCAVIFALSLLFIRIPLPDLTVIFSRTGAIFINAYHQGWTTGNIQPKQLTSIINHFALRTCLQNPARYHAPTVFYFVWQSETAPALFINASSEECLAFLQKTSRTQCSLLVIRLKSTGSAQSQEVPRQLLKILQTRAGLSPHLTLMLAGHRWFVIDTNKHITSGYCDSQATNDLAFTMNFAQNKITYLPPGAL